MWYSAEAVREGWVRELSGEERRDGVRVSRMEISGDPKRGTSRGEGVRKVVGINRRLYSRERESMMLSMSWWMRCFRSKDARKERKEGPKARISPIPAPTTVQASNPFHLTHTLTPFDPFLTCGM